MKREKKTKRKADRQRKRDKLQVKVASKLDTNSVREWLLFTFYIF